MAPMDPGPAFVGFASLALGLALAGVVASGLGLVTRAPASFGLLRRGGPLALAAVPALVLAAPFIILRNTARGRRFERRPVGFVAAATVIALLWGMASGRALLVALGA